MLVWVGSAKPLPNADLLIKLFKAAHRDFEPLPRGLTQPETPVLGADAKRAFG